MVVALGRGCLKKVNDLYPFSNISPDQLIRAAKRATVPVVNLPFRYERYPKNGLYYGATPSCDNEMLNAYFNGLALETGVLIVASNIEPSLLR